MSEEETLHKDVSHRFKANRELHKRVKEIRADTNYDFVIDTVSILENCKSKETEALAVVNILDERVRIKLDTGAEVNVMPSRMYQKLVFNKKISRDAKINGTDTKLTRYGGAETPVKGTCRLPCSFKCHSFMLVLHCRNR